MLLTELEGTAITAVQIKGINNEFATIPGVREDVLEILLNLKQIKFQGLLETPFLTSIVLKGPQLVTADHIVLPPTLNILNPNHYIATISEQTNLELELKIESIGEISLLLFCSTAFILLFVFIYSTYLLISYLYD